MPGAIDFLLGGKMILNDWAALLEPYLGINPAKTVDCQRIRRI
jgi:hypothetical protein